MTLPHVFVPSVQHTGTWFTIDFLRKFFPRNRELTFALEAAEKPEAENIDYAPKYADAAGQATILHLHLPISTGINEDSTNGTPFHRKWYANLKSCRSLPVSTLLLFCNLMKTVVPLRDPLAAILTRETRHPQFRHFCIVDGFVALATEFARHPNVVFLPIDRAQDTSERLAILINVAAHVGIDPDDYRETLIELAERWPVANDTPGNRFKEAYTAGDMQALQTMLGPKWAEVEYMKNMMSIILPFLASQGYRREQFIW